MERLDDGSAGVTRTDPARRERRTFLVVGVVAVLGLALWGGGLWWSSAAEFSDGSTVSDRRDVLRQAEQFTVAYNTYDSADVDEFEARIDDLATPAFVDADLHRLFVEHLRFGTQTFGVSFTQEATVRASAVTAYDGDTASVLVVIAPSPLYDLDEIDLDAVGAGLSDEQRAEIIEERAGGEDLPAGDLAALLLLDYLQGIPPTPSWNIELERQDGSWRIAAAEHLRYGFSPDAGALDEELPEVDPTPEGEEP